MTIPMMSRRAVAIAIALEACWLALIVWNTFDLPRGYESDVVVVRVELQNLVQAWAEPALAILAGVWFADLAVRSGALRRRAA